MLIFIYVVNLLRLLTQVKTIYLDLTNLQIIRAYYIPKDKKKPPLSSKITVTKNKKILDLCTKLQYNRSFSITYTLHWLQSLIKLLHIYFDYKFCACSPLAWDGV